MRTLQENELAAVNGGGFWAEILKLIGGEIAVGAIQEWYSANIGVAGPGASEMDNGGTSYGIGVCNTFGCSPGDWPSAGFDSGEFGEFVACFEDGGVYA